MRGGHLKQMLPQQWQIFIKEMGTKTYCVDDFLHVSRRGGTPH